MVEAIAPSSVGHQGYDTKGPKDLPLAKTFEIWLPEDEGSSIFDTLTLVYRCNTKISRKDLEIKHSAKGNGGVLHVVSAKKLLLTLLKEMQYNSMLVIGGCSFGEKKMLSSFRTWRRHRDCQRMMILVRQ